MIPLITEKKKYIFSWHFMLLFGHSLLTALDFMGALLHGCGSSTGITQEIFPRVNSSSSLPSLFTILSLFTEKESSRKFASLRGSRVLPEKLLTQPYPQTRWDFSIIVTQCNLCVLNIRTQGATPDFRALLGLLPQRITATQDFILLY